MPADVADLTIEQGSTFDRGWRVTYAGVLVDATWTGKCQIRERVNSPTVLYEVPVTVDAAGTVAILIAAAVSSAFTWTNGCYDVEISKGVITTRVAQGRVTISPEVTR